MHQGPVDASISMSVCATVSPIPLRFFGTGGSLAETGFALSKPHLIAREKALDRTPAMLRTVLAERGRGSFVPR